MTRPRSNSRGTRPAERPSTRPGHTFYRGGGAGAMPRGLTAADIIDHEHNVINEAGDYIRTRTRRRSRHRPLR